MKNLLMNIINDYRTDCDIGAWEKEDFANYLINSGVIVPPCKVGQTVYHIRRTPPSKGGSYVVEAKVWSITTIVSSSGTHSKINIQYISREGVHESADSIFGKYAFLTREEAEKALERSENGKS